MSRIFECSAEGGPGNRFSWSKLPDGVTITGSSGLVIMVDSASVGGTYQCTVENMAGFASATAVLNGKVLFLYLYYNYNRFFLCVFYSLPAVFQVISQHPQDTNVTRTENLALVCEADGFPVPNITWTHNGTIINPETSDSVIITEKISMDVQKTSTLTVSNTTSRNSGHYWCVVTSAPFTDINSDPALVLIQGQPLYCH